MELIKFNTREIYVHDKSELIANEIITADDFYEYPLLNYIAHNHNKNKTIVDIGANIGNHSCYFCEHLQFDKLRCFEPSQKNFSILEQNLKLYDANNKAVTYNMALSDVEKKVAILENNRNMGATRLIAGENITARPLDSFGFNDVTLIKLDVEGHELQVLKGAKETIMTSRPVLFVELLENKTAIESFIYEELDYIAVNSFIFHAIIETKEYIPKERIHDKKTLLRNKRAADSRRKSAVFKIHKSSRN